MTGLRRFNFSSKRIKRKYGSELVTTPDLSSSAGRNIAGGWYIGPCEDVTVTGIGVVSGKLAE